MKKIYWMQGEYGIEGRAYSSWDCGVISVIRYLVAIALFVGSIYFIGKTTVWCDTWAKSTIIGASILMLLTLAFAIGHAVKEDEDAFCSRKIATFFLMLGITGISIQVFFLFPCMYALAGLLAIPLIWVILPRIYPTCRARISPEGYYEEY